MAKTFGSQTSLYRDSPRLDDEDGSPVRLTRLLDLMDADEFLVGR